MSVARSSRSSTVKQRGAAMSSKQMAPKVGARREPVRTISSVSCVSRQIGKASTPAKVLKSTALPSMIVSAAWGPRLPRLSIVDTSVLTAVLVSSRRGLQIQFVLGDRVVHAAGPLEREAKARMRLDGARCQAERLVILRDGLFELPLARERLPQRQVHGGVFPVEPERLAKGVDRHTRTVDRQEDKAKVIVRAGGQV